VIVSYMLQGILGTDTGLINNMIVAGGGSRINFYSTPSYWYPILLLLNIWKNTGYNTIVYLAAITGIDEGLYEAAYIDGATRFKRIIYITIPLLTPTICIMTLMSVGRIFYGDFGCCMRSSATTAR
ncbi:MAG: ABC transporter permease subunit, partial [Butyricicoccus sp.]